jgi:hypothetical protein
VSAIVLALTTLAATAAAQSDSSWRDHERALQVAREANDTVNYRAQLNAEYDAIGATPRIASQMAAGTMTADAPADAPAIMRVRMAP